MVICLHTNFEISQNYIGGTERFLVKLAKELKLLGFKPFIVCSSRQKEFIVEGIKVFGRVPKKYEKAAEDYSYFSSKFIKSEIIRGSYSEESLKRLAEYTSGQLEGVKADVYHLNSFASAAYMNLNKRFVVTNHENNLEYETYWGDGFFDFFAEKIKSRKTNLQNAGLLITPSKYYAKEFSAKFDLDIKNVTLGIPLQDYLPGDKVRNTTKEVVHRILQPSRFVIKQKGIDISLKACKILKDRNINFELIFTGLKKSYKKYLPDFIELSEKLEVNDCVRVTNYDSILSAYSECDIVISPERYCSFGLAICETIAIGIPTVLSDIPTYKEIATGYENAIFFKSESPEDLAEKILIGLEYPRNHNSLSNIHFRMSYDFRKCTNEYATIYRGLIN